MRVNGGSLATRPVVDMEKRQKTVLIVNGASKDRAEFRKKLIRDNDAHYSVIEAETAARAIELYRERSPDWVILDQDLPDGSGLDLLKQLSGEEKSLDCDVLLLSDSCATPLAHDAVKFDANDCLEKNRSRVEQIRRVASLILEEAARRRSGIIDDAMETSEGAPESEGAP